MAKARDLSPELQHEIGRLMLAFVGDEGSVYRFTPEAELDESDAAEARGGYATDAEIRAIWAMHGLRSCGSPALPRPSSTES